MFLAGLENGDWPSLEIGKRLRGILTLHEQHGPRLRRAINADQQRLDLRILRLQPAVFDSLQESEGVVARLESLADMLQVDAGNQLRLESGEIADHPRKLLV